ncbi:ABC transporter permease [Metallosphaera sedula]|uniref:ABC transporter permease n=1 Tax=Metallosphaera sedula TaxID=43687 RepID=A0A0K1SV62_9CREN|nr:MFS transporter [Metallosphaera sedula]AKV78525.1 ABC transporter permease [Metallosphaera sedula]AKV80770.1 ABC transporter permease [Metallosphaera sedula]
MVMKGTAVGWFGTFLQLTVRLSWGIIVVPISALLHLNPVQMGLVATFFYVGYVASSVPWGLMIDKVGPVKAMLIASFPLAILNLFLFFYLSYPILLGVYLVEGLIASAIFPSAMKIVSILHSKDERLTFYVALLETASPITILVLSLVAGLLLNFWRFFFLGMTAMFLVFAGLTLSLRMKIESSEIRRSFRVILRREIFLATLLRLGELWATWGTTTWIFSMLVLYRHFPSTLSTLFLGLFGLGQLVGIISVEKAVKRIGDINLIFLSLVGFIIISLSIVFSPEIAVIGEALLLGIFSFSYRPPTDSLIMKIAGSGSAATSIGYANAVSQVGTMIAQVFIGIILYLTKSFTLSVLGLDTGCAIGIASLVVLSKILSGNLSNYRSDRE